MEEINKKRVNLRNRYIKYVPNVPNKKTPTLITPSSRTFADSLKDCCKCFTNIICKSDSK